ncbi:MAG TPA: c-type cytochrome [Casimicrobiaceae bacterium]|nr:c-type cytochrome [Casimicrobiaceae bacterium]
MHHSNHKGGTAKLLAMILAGGLAAAGAVHAQDAQALLEKYKCNACHAMNQAMTGPAYADVAARYRGDAKAVSTLSAGVRSGAHGAGPWHMPPHPEISESDARKMVRYILALKG